MLNDLLFCIFFSALRQHGDVSSELFDNIIQGWQVNNYIVQEIFVASSVRIIDLTLEINTYKYLCLLIRLFDFESPGDQTLEHVLSPFFRF